MGVLQAVVFFLKPTSCILDSLISLTHHQELYMLFCLFIIVSFTSGSVVVIGVTGFIIILWFYRFHYNSMVLQVS